ncbi:MAG: uracil-DNA glycosylase family protein, partial [Pseudomonadota bacterium]
MSAVLSQVTDRIAGCDLCAERFAATETAHQPRPVVRPSTTARVLIAGQAPGARVHASGIPFDDPSGDRLRDWLGVDRETFYDTSRLAIIPMAFCFPGYRRGSDLPPPPICAKTWRDELMAAMPQVELILTIGQYAQGWHMGRQKKRTVTETVRAWREYIPEQLPLPHPSWR